VTLFPFAVRPVILDEAKPCGLCAIRVNDPAVAPAPAWPVADVAGEPPVNIKVITVMASVVTSAMPMVILPLDPE
jgi:hypothetical protein